MNARERRIERRRSEMIELLQLFISAGPDVTIKTAHLERCLGTGNRDIRRLMSGLRKRLRGGTIVDGDDGGYKLSTDPETIKAHAGRLQRHAISEMIVCHQMRKAANAGQIRLEFDVNDEFTV